MRIINTRAELVALAKELGVRPDWHEPDEQDVTARIVGPSLAFDNAMGADPNGGFELNVVFCRREVDQRGYVRRGADIAVVNLATLFAWATGYETEQPGAVMVDLAQIRRLAAQIASTATQIAPVARAIIDATRP